MDACCFFPQCVLVFVPLVGVWLVLWWPQPALAIKWDLLFVPWLSLPCQGQDLLFSCLSRSSQISFWAVVWGRWDWSTPAGRRATEYSSARALHLSALCVVTCHPFCGLTQYTVFHTALSPASPLEIQAISPGVPSTLCSQTYRHRSISIDPLKSCTRTALVVHLDLPWELWKQLRPQLLRPQLPRPDPSQPQEHLFFTQMSHRCWVYKAGGGGINLGERTQISVLLSKSHGPWDSALISAPFPCVGNLLVLVGPQNSCNAGWECAEKEAAMAGPTPPFEHHFTIVLHFCGRPMLSSVYTHPTPTGFQPVQWSSPFRLSLLSQPQSSSQVGPLKPKFHHPVPTPTSTCVSRAGEHRMVAQTICVSLSLFCLPQTGCCALLRACKVPFVFRLISPLVKGLPRVRKPSSFTVPSQGPGGTGSILIPFCFSFFCSTQLREDISCDLGCLRYFVSV